MPLAFFWMISQFLEAKVVTDFGAFMDWGLPKEFYWYAKAENGVKQWVQEKNILANLCKINKQHRLIGVEQVPRL